MVWAPAIAQIKKRDGRIVEFDRAKIAQAIVKAAQAVQGRDLCRAEELAGRVVELVAAESQGKIPTVEAIQDTIEKVLIEQGHARTAKAFILYRARRSRIREGKTELMDAVADILASELPDEGASRLPAARLLAIGAAASREYYLNRFLPERLADAHLEGDLHIHGLAHYAKLPHAVALPYRRLLTEGFMSAHAHIRPPRRADSAAALTGLMLHAAQADAYGGLVLASFDEDFAAALPAGTDAGAIAQAMEALVHQLNALPTPASGELPRVTLQVGLAEDETGVAVTRALLAAIARGLGRGEAPLRPHVVYRLRAGVNLNPADPHHALTLEAAELARRSLALTFVHDPADAAFAGHEGRLIGPEGLAAGACQIARVTLNLPRLALKARREGLDFWRCLAAGVELAAEQLHHRYRALGGRMVADYPFLVGQHLLAGAEGLKPTDAIAPVLANGTLAIGFVGLAEALVFLSGQHHGESSESQALGLAIVEAIAHHAARLSADLDLKIVVQGSDAIALGDRLARLDRRAYGLIKNVTETEAYTSASALPADFAIDPAERLAIEGAYAPHLQGGSVSVLAAAEPPAVDRILAWARQLAASGQQGFALAFPLASCQACGQAGPQQDACSRCDSPASMQRQLVRRRGYLTLAP